MRSNGRSPGGPPVKTVANCYNVTCTIGYGVFIVFQRDMVTTWSLPNRAVDLVDSRTHHAKAELISKLSRHEGLVLRNRERS